MSASYEYARGTINNPSRVDGTDRGVWLWQEVVAAIPDWFESMSCDVDTCTITGSRELTAEEQDTLDSTVAAHKAGGTCGDLTEVQDALIVRIKEKRDERFTCDLALEWPPSSGKKFGVACRDQSRWHQLYTVRNQPIYPFRVRTRDERDEHYLADDSEVESVWGSVCNLVIGEFGTSQAALDGVVAATTVEDAVAAAAAYLDL